MSDQCVDQVVGDILAGWRYDISGITPEMRGDYEEHFRLCAHCRGRQHLHRTIDIGLIAVASVSAVAFLVAFGAIRHYDPQHARLLEFGALIGFIFSTMMWLIVAISTPAPIVITDAAKVGARRIHARLPAEIRDRLPAEIRERFPEELRAKNL
jgi:uncharacterized membrane protein